MISRHFPLVLSICLAFPLLPAAAQQSECADTLTEDFFRSATLESIAPCAAVPEYLTLRTKPDGNTPLHLAAAYASDPAVVRELLLRGARVDLINQAKETALHQALRHNSNVAVVVNLLHGGADPDVRISGDDGCDNWLRDCLTGAIHIATRREDALDLLIALLFAGADVNILDVEGRTPLHIVADTHAGPTAMEILLKAGAETQEEDPVGFTPLHFLAQREDAPLSLADLLLADGADADANADDKITPFMMAAAYADGEVFRRLFDASDEPCAKSDKGLSALDYRKASSHEPDSTYWELNEICGRE